MTDKNTNAPAKADPKGTDLLKEGIEHREKAIPDAVVVDEDNVEDGAEVINDRFDDEKTETLTVAKDNAVFDGDGGYYKKGTKLINIDKESAKSLRDKGVAK